MPDVIEPPAARRPEEALELVSQALSDGDLEAALAQYEKGALLACWPRCWPRGDDPARPRGEASFPDPPGGTPRGAVDDGDVRSILTCVMALRLPLSVRVVIVLESPELALVVCARQIAGTGPDGEPVRLAGHGCAVLRPQPDGSWRIAADVWHAGPELPPDPSQASRLPERTRHGPFG